MKSTLYYFTVKKDPSLIYYISDRKYKNNKFKEGLSIMIRPEEADYMLVKILQFEEPNTEKTILIRSEDFFKSFTTNPYIFVYDQEDLYERGRKQIGFVYNEEYVHKDDPKVIGKIKESTISSMEIIECYKL